MSSILHIVIFDISHTSIHICTLSNNFMTNTESWMQYIATSRSTALSLLLNPYGISFFPSPKNLLDIKFKLYLSNFIRLKYKYMSNMTLPPITSLSYLLCPYAPLVQSTLIKSTALFIPLDISGTSNSLSLSLETI